MQVATGRAAEGAPAAARRAVRARGLRYVTDAEPGIRRVKRGNGFIYLAPGGRRITHPAHLARIRSLAIPPAYESVWICPSPDGHLQATGRDARGRKQYRYHPLWRAQRESTKFERMLEFSQVLPRVRRRVEQDLRLPGLPREKVLATIVKLLDRTRVRIGNEEYARTNRSYGLTTLRDRHVEIHGRKVKFEFRGKHNIIHSIEVDDASLARIVQRCQDIPGQELFQWIDDQGRRRRISSTDVNDYIRQISGGDFTAKDFRTRFATLRALRLLYGQHVNSQREAKRVINDCIRAVAEKLGNTPTICRKCYIHPRVFESYLDGSLAAIEHRNAVRTMQRLLRSSRKSAHSYH